jgi:transcriptional antiterminator
VVRDKYDSKIIITMPELMEQMECSDKTIYRLIQEGEIPDFTYGSKWNKKKGWHTAVLERHAMEKYEKSQSLRDAHNTSQIITENLAILPTSRRDKTMPKQDTKLNDKDTPKQELNSKKNKRVFSFNNSRVMAGFAEGPT